MHNSDLITPQHLSRKAAIYIRQSTPHQVLSHQESLRLQYALLERARQLGWPDEAIDIIDDDLGEEMKVTVIAAGFEGRRRPNRPPIRAAEEAGMSAFDDDALDIPSFVQG